MKKTCVITMWAIILSLSLSGCAQNVGTQETKSEQISDTSHAIWENFGYEVIKNE